ncbi:MAG: arylsulfatase [Undibacterium sp.]|nr:arylsulfatase [Opitutaceae bacterium]
MILRLLAALLLCACARAGTPPNIVYILADDLGIGDVSCYNSKSAWQTPHIDRLAREGVRFTDAHSASSLCTPSRYALLTGRYAWRGSLKQGVLQGHSPALIEPGRATVASFLREHGYTTAMFGKWHLGLDWARAGPQPEAIDYTQPFAGGPTAHGFDRFFGISASLDMPPYVWLAQDRVTALPTATLTDSRAPKLWRAGPLAPDFKLEEVQPRLTAEAIAYITERADAKNKNPFFLYLPLAAPHTPILPTREFEGKTHATAYGDFVTQVDADLGKILAALEKNGFAQNTLVIFTSDNGFAPAADVPAHTGVNHDPSGGYRGYKSDLFEGGHRIPFIARWPAVIRAGTTSDALVGQLDLFATCAELLGAKIPDTAAEDSMSFLPILRSGTGLPSVGSSGAGVPPMNSPTPSFPPPRTSLVNHSAEGRFAIREGRWKLLLWPGSGGWSAPTPKPGVWLKVERTDLAALPPYQLYDLAADPAETKNLAAARPEIVQSLGRRLRVEIETGRSTPGAGQPFTSGADWPQIDWRAAFAP